MSLTPPLFNERLGYTAQFDRQIIAALCSSGVFDAGDFVCSASTGFTSGMASGRAAIEGSEIAFQGTYVVFEQNALTVAHTTPNGSNPRIDQIVLQINDSTDGGSASDNWEPVVVAGTAKAGATLENREGVGTLPSNSLLLYDVLVPAAAGSAASFTYRDRRTTAQSSATQSVKRIIAGEDTITSATFALAANPDQVDIVVPTSGLVAIGFQGQWSSSVSEAGRAQIFVDGNQLKYAKDSSAAPATAEEPHTVTTIIKSIYTTQWGLSSNQTATAYTGDVATGQILGGGFGAGILYAFMSAGAHKISVRYLSPTGNVKVKERKLFAWVVA